MIAEFIRKLIGQARAKAWVDKGAGKASAANPKGTKEELGGTASPKKLKSGAPEGKTDCFTIPAETDDAELNDEQLDAVTGGWSSF